MPSSPGYKRDYAQERKTAKRRGETGAGSKSGDAQRHRARRKYENAHGDVPSNVDIDHKRKVKDGGGNSLRNLRKRSRSANRSDNGHSKR